MRLAIWAIALGWTAAGCAVGLPAGSAVAVRSNRYQPFTPSAIPRGIPAPPPASPRPPSEPILRGGRREAVSLAREMMGRTRIRLGGQVYPNDCTGLVVGIYDQLGIPLMSGGGFGDNGVTSIFRFAGSNGRIFHNGRPLPGDLVFFKETYDLNRDGRMNDGLTHVGLVEDVDELGTVSVIHRVKRGVVRYRMNVERKHERYDPVTGRLINDYLRNAGPRENEALTGELFAGYATLLPVRGRWYAGR
ncbi:MAG: CHAP domain-containing protein [Myxococcaceae bacterium]